LLATDAPPATAIEGPDPRECLALKIVGPSGRSALFLKLKDLFPECMFQIEDAAQLFPFICLRGSCPRNHNCMGKLVSRLKCVFDTWPDTHLVLLYFSWRDMPGSQRAGVFWRDMREPRYITFNRTGWEKLKTIGTVYKWHVPDELFLSS
jgi:hypothetical protein